MKLQRKFMTPVITTRSLLFSFFPLSFPFLFSFCSPLFRLVHHKKPFVRQSFFSFFYFIFCLFFFYSFLFYSLSPYFFLSFSLFSPYWFFFFSFPFLFLFFHSLSFGCSFLTFSEIDIIIDLCGHADHPKLGSFAYRPAPVQISFLGYPGIFSSHFF